MAQAFFVRAVPCVAARGFGPVLRRAPVAQPGAPDVLQLGCGMLHMGAARRRFAHGVIGRIDRCAGT